MRRLRVAIVGCGKMGREHARAARALGADVTWTCDAEISRAIDLSRGYRCTATVAAEDIDWASLDAVFVCTPPFARGPVERRAITARVPFFVEEPIGLSAEEATAVLRALRDAPIIHSVGYMFRYRRSVLEARARLEGSRILGASCAWVGKIYGRPWWLDPRGSGGPFNEQATHLVDLCRFLVGEIVEVTAIGIRSLAQVDIEDTVVVAFRLQGGAGGTLLYSCLGTDKEIGLEVFSSAGRVRLEGWDLRPSGGNPGGGNMEDEEDVFELEAAAFFEAIKARDQGLVLCDLEDAVRTQRVVDAIRRSARTGRPELVASLHGGEDSARAKEAIIRSR